ncbi:MAG TPA: hypothetical protein VJJ22_03715 [Candidatus Paceibacterota bacterium]
MNNGIKIIVVLVLLVLAFLGLNYLKSSNTAPTSAGGLVSENFNNSISSENQDFLRALKNLESVSLDGSMFSSEAFNSLIDFSVTLVPQPVGRPNPFRPINLLEADFSAFSDNVSSTTSL